MLDRAGILVFQLVQAAAPAAVAQRFPFGPVEIRQRQVPEALPQLTHFSRLALTEAP